MCLLLCTYCNERKQVGKTLENDESGIRVGNVCESFERGRGGGWEERVDVVEREGASS